MRIIVGAQRLLTARFTDSNGIPTDPPIVSAVVKSPSGVHAAYSYNPGPIVRDATGEYHFSMRPTSPGTWFYQWTAADNSGALAISDPAFFIAETAAI